MDNYYIANSSPTRLIYEKQIISFTTKNQYDYDHQKALESCLEQ